MSLWIWLVALVPPVLFALSNLIDKKVLHGDKQDNNSCAIIAMSAVFSLIVCIPVGIFCWATNNWPTAGTFWFLFVNGATYTFAVWLFFQSIKVEEASKVVPIFQTVPAFGILLGFYGLNQILGWGVLAGILLLMVGGYVLSVTKGKINKRILVMMLLSSALYAVNDYVVAKYGREMVGNQTINSFATSMKGAAPVILADLMGKIFFGIILLVGRKQRVSFLVGFKSNFGLISISSVTYSLGDIAFDATKIFAPLALVQALCCTQPLFVLIGVVGLALFCKSFPKEELSRGTLTQKIVGVALMAIGGILLSI